MGLGSLKTKWHLGVGPMVRHKRYYKGEGGGFPQVLSHGEYCESVFARGSSVHQKCYNYALPNLLFGLCRYVWVIDLLVILPNPYPIAATRPSTPRVLRAKECTPTLHYSVMFTLDSHLSLLKNLGVHHRRSRFVF